ncbi:MAG TPA: ABC transporter substrate-binding protein [Xanthobacteraceae bacterium]|nr:ABC transporter substrate-binding protein [Xanthobacteraceae bacterium]
MKRRDFITLIGGAAAAPVMSSLAARAQQPALPVVGFVRSTSLAPFQSLVVAFGDGLKEAGFVAGQNVAIEYRYAENQRDRLPALVAELLGIPVAVLVVNSSAAAAAKAATTTVPIVVVAGADPVKDGLVASLNRPGGNITGVSWLGAQIGAKRLELLRQIVPKTTTIGMLEDLSSPGTEAERTDVQAAAQAIGLQLIIIDVNNDSDIETAIASFVQRGAGALLVGAGAFVTSKRESIAALAARHAIPAMYVEREGAVAGGLMSYGPSQSEAYRQAAIYAGRILKGEKPADLPVMQSTKFEFVLNMKTAKALGLTVPMIVQMTADEVIE